MLKLLPKSKYLTEMLYVLTEHTLIIYVQFIRFQEKNFSLSSEHFDLDSIFKRFEFDYSS